MMRNNIGVVWNKTRQSLMRLTIGGDWALALPKPVKRNLRWYWLDGLFSAASDNILLTYLSVYILALGATRSQVGLMSSLSSLSAALLLLPGAFLVERYGYRKQFTVIFGGVISRLMILFLAFVPFFIEAPAVVWVAILIAVARDAFVNLAFPGWMSITGDIVPINGRGRYFGSRNFVMAIAGILTTLLIGELITQAGSPGGYQIAIMIAFLFGVVSTFSFAHIRDPKGNAPIAASSTLSFSSIWGDLRVQRTIVALFATTALWNFSLNIAGPFFTVYLVQELHATAAMVGLTSVATSVASMLVQRRVGALSDRWGPRRVQLMSMLLIPILPTCWIFITQPWQVIPVNLLGGVLWGAYSLASFNYVLALFPDAVRARYSALYQIVVTLALAGGAAVGSLVISKTGYQGIFILSALGRVIAGLVFARFVRPSRLEQISVMDDAT
jgi:MFS family permease